MAWQRGHSSSFAHTFFWDFRLLANYACGFENSAIRNGSFRKDTKFWFIFFWVDYIPRLKAGRGGLRF
jgi:hypothetical protein